ncbi:hypothetical protein L1049_009477 [Liquidambar formosana]|uniref:Uncharacterized protein n=1 Tax=Liquidambar formosana TaxID=63359 RepID=A0AAP0S5G2_LIQFO
MAASTSSSEIQSESSDLPQGSESPPVWMYHLKDKLASIQLQLSKGSSIRRAPNQLRKVDEEAYSPRIVSIGPLHSSTTKDRDHLLAMDELKLLYTVYLVHRTTDPNKILHQCGEAIFKLADDRVRPSYAEDIKFKRGELAEIMLVDGCFILELFFRSRYPPAATEEDPIFHNAWMDRDLRHDLALLENQIPFFILQVLFNKIVSSLNEENKFINPSYSVNYLALSFFNLDQEAIRRSCSQDADHLPDPDHLLDLLHHSYVLMLKPEGSNPTNDLHVPVGDDTTARDDSEGSSRHTQNSVPVGKECRGFTKNATELLEAGIVFKKSDQEAREGDWLKISHLRSGVITIPPLRIDERRKSLLRNLVAFEQCLSSRGKEFTSYAILMNSLIHHPRDVELLRKKGIITNDLIEVEGIFNFFKNITVGVVSKNYCFGKLCEDVNAYQESGWNWHRLEGFVMVWCYRCMEELEELKRKYFSSPWTTIAVMAASAGLFLTALQTYYAARSDGA